jgi:hypothetical protein
MMLFALLCLMARILGSNVTLSRNSDIDEVECKKRKRMIRKETVDVEVKEENDEDGAQALLLLRCYSCCS